MRTYLELFSLLIVFIVGSEEIDVIIIFLGVTSGGRGDLGLGVAFKSS